MVIRVHLIFLVEGLGDAHLGQVYHVVLHEHFQHVAGAAGHDHTVRPVVERFEFRLGTFARREVSLTCRVRQRWGGSV